jgi:hypothetical protein
MTTAANKIAELTALVSEAEANLAALIAADAKAANPSDACPVHMARCKVAKIKSLLTRALNKQAKAAAQA